MSRNKHKNSGLFMELLQGSSDIEFINGNSADMREANLRRKDPNNAPISVEQKEKSIKEFNEIIKKSGFTIDDDSTFIQYNSSKDASKDTITAITTAFGIDKCSKDMGENLPIESIRTFTNKLFGRMDPKFKLQSFLLPSLRIFNEELKAVEKEGDYDRELICEACTRKKKTSCKHNIHIPKFCDGGMRNVVSQLLIEIQDTMKNVKNAYDTYIAAYNQTTIPISDHYKNKVLLELVKYEIRVIDQEIKLCMCMSMLGLALDELEKRGIKPNQSHSMTGQFNYAIVCYFTYHNKHIRYLSDITVGLRNVFKDLPAAKAVNMIQSARCFMQMLSSTSVQLQPSIEKGCLMHKHELLKKCQGGLCHCNSLYDDLIDIPDMPCSVLHPMFSKDCQSIAMNSMEATILQLEQKKLLEVKQENEVIPVIIQEIPELKEVVSVPKKIKKYIPLQQVINKKISVMQSSASAVIPEQENIKEIHKLLDIGCKYPQCGAKYRQFTPSEAFYTTECMMENAHHYHEDCFKLLFETKYKIKTAVLKNYSGALICNGCDGTILSINRMHDHVTLHRNLYKCKKVALPVILQSYEPVLLIDDDIKENNNDISGILLPIVPDPIVSPIIPIPEVQLRNISTLRKIVSKKVDDSASSPSINVIKRTNNKNQHIDVFLSNFDADMIEQQYQSSQIVKPVYHQKFAELCIVKEPTKYVVLLDQCEGVSNDDAYDMIMQTYPVKVLDMRNNSDTYGYLAIFQYNKESLAANAIKSNLTLPTRFIISNGI